MIYYFISLILIVADQISKYFIRVGMNVNESHPIFVGIFHITYVQNYGAAFSILQGKQLFLIPFTLVALVTIIIFMVLKMKQNHRLLSASLSLIVGGGFGNLIDRIRLGYVVDFIDFRVFPVFNIADICVTAGCVLIIIYILFFDSGGNNKRIDEE